MKRFIYILLLLLFLIILLSSGKNEEGIYMYKNNPQRTGYYDTYGPDKTPVIKWKIDLKKKLKGKQMWLEYQPLIVNDVLYIFTRGTYQRILAINIKNGRIKWKIEYDPDLYGVIKKTPIIKDNKLIVFFDTVIKLIDIKTKKELWTYKIEGTEPYDSPIILSEPVLGDGVIYIGETDYRKIPDDVTDELPETYLLAIDAETGKRLWKLKLQDGGISDLAYDKGYLYFSLYDRSYCMDVKTREFKWISDRIIEYHKAIITEDKLIGWYYNGDIIKALDKETGKLLWEKKFEGEIYDISYNNNKIYTGIYYRNKDKSSMLIINSKNGNKLKEIFVNDYIVFHYPFIIKNLILFKGFKHLYGINTKTNEIKWVFNLPDSKNDDFTYTGIIYNKKIFIYTRQSKIFCLEEKN